MDKAIDRRDVKVINKSKDSIYCLMSGSNSFKTPYIDYSEAVINENYIIPKDTFINIIDKPLNWEEYIMKSDEGKMRLFIISKDSVVKYGWREVLTRNIYTKVYQLTIDDLNNNHWQVLYEGN